MGRPLGLIGAIGLLLAGAAIAACDQDGKIKVDKITFKGVASVSVDALRAALATRQSSILPWGRKAYFDRSQFEADLKRIGAFYADRGFPDARVSGFNVSLNRQQDAADIEITVTEGEPVRIASVRFVGFDPVPPRHLDEIRSRMPLKIGQPRDRQQVLSTHELALNELRDHGYPYAKVATQEDDGPTGKTAAISFVADPGPIAYFGPVAIVGNQTVGDEVIRRELAYKPGDLYRRSLVQETQRRLYRLELFQFAAVEPLTGQGQPSEVPTRITVVEGKHHRVTFGAGYGTEERARVDAEYHNVNFLGGARSAGAHLRWSSLDRGVRLDFTQPYFLAPHFSFNAQAQQWYTFTPAYDSVVSGGKVNLTHRAPDGRTSWSVSITSERDSSSIASDALSDLTLRNNLIALGLDPRTGEQRGTLNALGFDFQRSTADNALNAHRGYQLAVHAEQAGRLARGTFNYDSATIDARHYLPLSGDAFVLATRLQAGTIRPLGNDLTNVPFSKKFFLGGATSVRGWGVYELSPLSGSGLPIGGDSMLAASAELRAVLRGSLGGVVFVDAGNVWPGAAGFALNDLRWAVGPGLRYQTPIGPIRFDVGYQVNPIPGLLVNGEPQRRRWRIHFSIGQAF